MTNFEDLDVEFSNTELGPQIKITGQNWNSQKVKAVKRLLDHAYTRWRKEQYKQDKLLEESEK